MYIFKNALKSIVRAKARNILVFTLVLVISISSCIALSIQKSAENAKASTIESSNITAQINVDRTKLMQSTLDKTQMMEAMRKTVSLEDMIKYSEAQSVQGFYYEGTLGLNGSSIEPYETAASSMGGGRFTKVKSDFVVAGYSSHEAITSFVDGTNAIKEGQFFNEDDTANSAVISQELAYQNELSVGSTFTLVNPAKEDEKVEFTVAGIFECESTDVYSNQIYISYPSAEAIVEHSKEVAQMVKDQRTGEEISSALTIMNNGTYVLKDQAALDSFKNEAVALGLDLETFTVSSPDIENYEKSIIPLENLSSFTHMFLVIVLIIGAIILVVFNLFSIRERKYEIGVLSAIGMHKPKVALQFVAEVMIVTILAVSSGAAIGAAASKPIGDSLLQNQIASVQAESTKMNSNFGGNFGGRGGGGIPQLNNATSQVDYLDTINPKMDMDVFVQLMGIGILLSLAASGVGVISILRYEPLKILSERA